MMLVVKRKAGSQNDEKNTFNFYLTLFTIERGACPSQQHF